MIEQGKRYFFKTLAHHYLGEVIAVTPTYVTLKDASEVYETGPLDDFYGRGKVKASERVPDGWMVPIGGGTCIGPWAHELPKKAVGV